MFPNGSKLYAPPFAKFNVKEKVPVQAATLSELQKAFLSAFAALIETRGGKSAEKNTICWSIPQRRGL